MHGDLYFESDRIDDRAEPRRVNDIAQISKILKLHVPGLSYSPCHDLNLELVC
jgi:hypothetical protein